jgi:hypothetical protein
MASQAIIAEPVSMHLSSTLNVDVWTPLVMPLLLLATPSLKKQLGTACVIKAKSSAVILKSSCSTFVSPSSVFAAEEHALVKALSFTRTG